MPFDDLLDRRQADAAAGDLFLVEPLEHLKRPFPELRINTDSIIFDEEGNSAFR